MQPGNPIVGGTVLRRPAIQSPDFVTGVSGWIVKIDGSAEFNNVSVRGSLGVGVAPTQIELLPAAQIPAVLLTKYPTAVAAFLLTSSANNYAYQIVTPTGWFMGSVAAGVVNENVFADYNNNGDMVFDGTDIYFRPSSSVQLDHATMLAIGDGINSGTNITLRTGSFIEAQSGSTIKVNGASFTSTEITFNSDGTGTPETWHAFPYSNSWTNSGGANAHVQYRKTAFGEVQIIGTAHSPAVFNAVMGVMPTGYRPTNSQGIWAWSNTGSGQLLRVDSGGTATTFGDTRTATDWWINGTYSLAL